MRKLAVLTTTAVVAMFGVANAQPAAHSHTGASHHSATATASTAAPTAQPSGGAPLATLPPGSLQAAVAGYAAYHSDVSDLRANHLANAGELETALDKAGRHNHDTLARGWVAYGAETAAQSPAFAQGVRDAASYYGRDAVVWALTVDPSYARGLRGGQEATKLMLDSSAADAARIISVADRYQAMAFDIQRQRWAAAVAPAQAARLARVRALSAPGSALIQVSETTAPRLAVAPVSLSPQTDPTVFGGGRFWDALNGGPAVVEVSAQTPHQWKVNVTRGEALDRMASIGALQILGAVDDHQSQVVSLMDDPRSRDCLEMAQLQLYQCMSAARFRYENAFCISEHGLRDVGRCIGAVAQPDTSAMPALTTPTAAPAPAASTTRSAHP